MLRRAAERDIRHAAADADETLLLEHALRILYERKAFREATSGDEERFPDNHPPAPAPPPRDKRPPGSRSPSARLTQEGPFQNAAERAESQLAGSDSMRKGKS